MELERGLFIAGVEQPAQSGKTFEVLSPSSESLFARVARSDTKDVDLAVACARNGFESWRRMAASEREAMLLSAADLIEREGEKRFLDLLIDESGSVVTKAWFEIKRACDFLRAAAGESRRLYGDTMPNDDPSRLSMVFREPLGVVAVVAPYNAPLLLLTKMTAFPLAAGNAVVVKPSEETPVIALEYAKLLIDAGLPQDAISVLPGFGQECGAPLVSHDGIDAVALTGSSQTGKVIGRLAIEKMRPMQLELGGKSALIILQDYNPEKAAQIAAQGMFNHAGQICMANSRIVVEKALYQDFLAAFKKVCESLVIGDVRNSEALYGPLINRQALEKVQAHIADAKLRGAELLTGGEVHSGLTLQPTVLISPPRDSTAWTDESFGPLTSVVEAEDVEEAIKIANDSVFGLSSAVLTNDIQKAFKVVREIRSGAVHIGTHSFQSNSMAPIGGLGDSGIGRSGGRYSTDEFTQLKWVSVDFSG